MDISSKKEKIRALLMESSINGKIYCPIARQIAEELSVPYREIGKAADDIGIKIMACELGCF